MKKILLIQFCLLLILSAKAQDQKTADDPMELTSQLEQIEKYGVPTIETVNKMKIKADGLYDALKWQEAIDAYELYAKNVNWLSNLLAQGLEPYYSDSYDDRKKASYKVLKPMIPIETKVNECRQERDIAYVKIGLCYKNFGDVKNAVAYLHKSLDLLSINNIAYWTIAKDALMEIIGFKSE